MSSRDIPVAVLVLGMHRSGTSALAGVLHGQGAWLPDELQTDNQDSNATGHWEPAAMVAADDAALAALDMDWRSVEAIPRDWFDSAGPAEAEALIDAFISGPCAGKRLILLKDPRACRTLPMWLKRLDRAGVRPVAALIFRNPLEVAASLAQRDGIGVQHALLLWLRHNLEAERHSRGVRRIVTTYEQLLQDWPAVTTRLALAGDVVWPANPHRARTKIDAFVSPGYRRQIIDEAALYRSDALALVREAYEALKLLAEDEASREAQARLDAVAAELDRAEIVMGGALADIAAGERAAQHAARVANDLAHARAQQLDLERGERIVADGVLAARLAEERDGRAEAEARLAALLAAERARSEELECQLHLEREQREAVDQMRAEAMAAEASRREGLEQRRAAELEAALVANARLEGELARERAARAEADAETAANLAAEQRRRDELEVNLAAEAVAERQARIAIEAQLLDERAQRHEADIALAAEMQQERARWSELEARLTVELAAERQSRVDTQAQLELERTQRLDADMQLSADLLAERQRRDQEAADLSAALASARQSYADELGRERADLLAALAAARQAHADVEQQLLLERRQRDEADAIRAATEDGGARQVNLAEMLALRAELAKVREIYEADVAAREREAQPLRAELARLREAEPSLRDEVVRLREELHAAHEELQRTEGYWQVERAAREGLQRTVSDIQRSTSWWLTKPVRAAKRVTQALPRIAHASLTGVWRNGHAEGELTPELQPSAIVVDLEPEPPPPPPPPPEIERPTDTDVRAIFDEAFYLDQNPDIAAAGVDAFGHFMQHGWRERRDPSPSFSVDYYLRRYPEIEQAGLNPLTHYQRYGRHERRAAIPFEQRLARAPYAPRVSAIVPNFNHARFLEQRLDSILNQTYGNVDVLVLDDCSSDDSRTIIESYRARYPSRVRALYNDANSGNVFRQWRAGVEASDGELIWICESDDFCDTNFLERMVFAFRDRSVNLAFGRIQFADAGGQFQEGLDQYREQAEPGIWQAPLKRPAHEWFAKGFGVSNLIANVGGCVFRNRKLADAVWREAETYRVVGDWFLYCHLANGGQIAYDPAAIAYFRQHGANTSVTSFKKPSFYEEHARLMALLRTTWATPEHTVRAHYDKLEHQYRHFGMESEHGPLSRSFDLGATLATTRERPHVLIAFLGFQLGGGEVFPINLANALHARGHVVSMLALDMKECKPEMLASLDPGVAVYDADWVGEYGCERFIAEAGVSVIHSHILSVEAFFFEQCRLALRLPYIVSLHGSYESTGLTAERIANFAHNVDRFVYLTERNRRPFRDLGLPERAFVHVPNAMPIDHRPFPKTRADLGIAEDAVVFTLVARGIERKGWRAACNALMALRAAHPNRRAHLLLCGDGEVMERQRELHGGDPDITFLGYQSHVQGVLRMSDVAILPTRFAGESFPLSLIQALQVGKPVISTHVGEIGNMVTPLGAPPAGILIEPVRDTPLFIRELQGAMAAMLNPETRAAYAEAAKKLGETYDMDEVARQYASLYEEVMGEHS